MAEDERAPAWFRAVTERFELGERSALLAGGRVDRRSLRRRAGRGRGGGDAGQHQRPSDLPAPVRGLPPPRAGGHRPRLHPVLARGGPRRRERRGTRRLLHDRRADRHGRLPDPDRRHRLASRFASRSCSRTGRSSDAGDADRFTTVATWRGPYGPVEVGGRTYGLKVHEFRKFIELPQRSSAALRDRPGHPPWGRAGPARPARARLGGGRPAAGGG